MRLYISNRQRKIKLNLRAIKKDSLKALRILGLEGAELSILFVSSKRMQMLNRTYRGIDKTTDVLSFPMQSPRDIRNWQGRALSPFRLESEAPLLPGGRASGGIALLGDIVINPSVALAQAKGHCLTFKEEIRWLIVHGLLHLLGYTHKGRYEERRMRNKELQLLQGGNDPGSLTPL